MADVWAVGISSGIYDDYRETEYFYDNEESAIEHKNAILNFLSNNEYSLKGYKSEYSYYNSDDSYDYDLLNETQNELSKLVGYIHSNERNLTVMVYKFNIRQKFETPVDQVN